MNHIVISHLVDYLQSMLGHHITYSRCGGGASSILLLHTDNNYSLMCWRYWEISVHIDLLACSEDDDTAIVGKMAVAARRIEDKKLLGFFIDDDFSLVLMFEEDITLTVFTEDFSGVELIYWELYNTKRSPVTFIVNENGELIETECE